MLTMVAIIITIIITNLMMRFHLLIHPPHSMGDRTVSHKAPPASQYIITIMFRARRITTTITTMLLEAACKLYNQL